MFRKWWVLIFVNHHHIKSIFILLNLHYSLTNLYQIQEVPSFLPFSSHLLIVADMEILVISQEDSRLPIVDLARTLGDMTKQEKLFSEDITIDLIHENLTGPPSP